ncbi:MAG: hypothetical protein LC737_08870 [Chloroflexi bacterium]|nr:hypothetical protein [Chloroflexota bacterium]
MLAEILPEASPTVEIFDQVEFINQGSNFEWVACPVCGSKLDVDWWGEAMNQAYKTSAFQNLLVQTPCCKAATTLNNLIYHWPAGFARFCISMMNPGGDIDLTTVQRVALELGTDIRKVWRHL